MRKIGILTAFVFMALVLVACGGSPKTVALYASVSKIDYKDIDPSEKIVYDEEINKYVEIYALKSNGTVEIAKIDPIIPDSSKRTDEGVQTIKITYDKLEVSFDIHITTLLGDVRGPSIKDVTKPFYVINYTKGLTELSDKTEAVKAAISPLITNKPDVSKITVLGSNLDKPFEPTPQNFIITKEDGEGGNFDLYQNKTKAGGVLQNGSYRLDPSANPEIKEDIVFDNVYTYKKGSNNPIHPKTASWHWDWVLVIPISFILQFFAFGNSFAWGILFATLIVRTIAWPIYAKSNALSMKMALAQPELQRLNDKYATRKDPASMQKKNAEMMKINKKYGINYLGCLMPVLQMPLFIAMYQVVSRIVVPGGMFADKVSKHTMMWGWIDLSVGQTSASYVLAAIVGITMFLLNKISTKKPGYAKQTGTQNKSPEALQQEKTMKMVNYIMIVMMVMGAFANNALAFYWIIGNVFAIGQTMITRWFSTRKYNKEKNKLIV